MDNRTSGAAGGGIGLSGLTFLIFLVLKLCKVIDWSWWWVTAPLWIPVAIVCGIFIITCVVIAIISAMRKWR